MSEGLELHNINIKEFCQVLDSCKGDVFLETDEGDCLNLKSKLCQFTDLTKLLENGMITKTKIHCTNQKDETKLFRFNLYKTK